MTAQLDQRTLVSSPDSFLHFHLSWQTGQSPQDMCSSVVRCAQHAHGLGYSVQYQNQNTKVKARLKNGFPDRSGLGQQGCKVTTALNDTLFCCCVVVLFSTEKPRGCVSTVALRETEAPSVLALKRCPACLIQLLGNLPRPCYVKMECALEKCIPRNELL